MELSDDDIKLINRVQRNFPLCKDPFAQISKELGLDKSWVISRLNELREIGVVSRFGSIAKRKNDGFSTLAALKVPPDRINDIAHLINSYEDVTHNYLREHEFNLWFVIQSNSEDKLNSALADLRLHMDFPMLNLPILESYHSDMVITL
ncbi:MAG: Lrp/AsnC family transcriptional regulator [Kangiellaceae bacterium]|nr:Lrp/AsnC family transcriptional regulator [Kangiellaceae bacterium]